MSSTLALSALGISGARASMGGAHLDVTGMPEATHSDKPILAGLIAFGVLALILGVQHLQRAIGGVRPSAAPANRPALATTREEYEDQQRALLATLDTDRDGLSDLDELERTHTSPYLEDSDSDGKSDRAEVEAGEDPNCPTGQVCVPQDGAAATPLLVPPSPLLTPRAPTIEGSALPSAGTTTSDAPPFTPAELRAALERQGMPRATLDALTDAQLQASYESTLRSLTTLPTGGASPIAATIRESFTSALRTGRGDPNAALATLPSSAPEIRQFLSRGGFPNDQLQQVDDATLLRIWQEVLAASRVQGTPTP